MSRDDELIWHDFDVRRRILRVAFVNERGILGVKYQLCPRCGVTMAEAESPEGVKWSCAICGTELTEAST